MARSNDKDEKFKQNKVQYESTVTVGKAFLELILKKSDPSVTNFKDKLNLSNAQLKKRFNKDEVALLEKGVNLYNLDKLDLSMLHKLIYHISELEDKAPDLQKDIMVLKDNRNDIAHIVDITKFTDMFIWRKIEELRNLFEKILIGIRDLYKADIAGELKIMNNKIDDILRNVEVLVTDLEVDPIIKELQEVGKCPFKVKIELKDFPTPELLKLIERLGKEDIKVKLLINKAYFEDVLPQFYDSQQYLNKLLDKKTGCKAQLTWYRGNLSNEMISILPSTMKQLYIRMRSDQVQHLNNQLPNIPDLWALALYLDLTEENNRFRFDTIDPSSLPSLQFKGKQLGLKFSAAITINDIPWIVEITKRLTKEHQCDTLEFYLTRLNSGLDIENLLRALHREDIHVTTWVKVQNRERRIDTAEERRLSILARNLSLRMFKFLRAW